VVEEEVDAVGPKPRERALERAPRVSRGPAWVVAVAGARAELGREHDAIAAAGQRVADHPLAGAVAAVDVGGVEERDPGVERGVDDGARAREVEPPAEVVATEADRGDAEVGTPETVLPHPESG